jgi:hypothetical protein
VAEAANLWGSKPEGHAGRQAFQTGSIVGVQGVGLAMFQFSGRFSYPARIMVYESMESCFVCLAAC